VYLIEPEIEAGGEVALDTHGMDPVKVLRFARVLGAEPVRTLVVGCEPGVVLTGESYEDVLVELSEPVQKAVGEAVNLVESLVGKIRAEDSNEHRELDAGSPKRDPERR
jgi:hydrogenase maturation protease